ncbi:MAG TPA: hypothetical protein VI731_06355 [Bacteroidia bacterium]|nr:hypothetical protein [Bacteroidia bacterium]
MRRELSNRPAVKTGQPIKVRLNDRTIIIVRSQEALRKWMNQFPAAQIIG